MENSSHNRPLYLEAHVNGVELRRAFVDGGSSVNIMSVGTFESVKIPKTRLVKQPIEITGFAGARIRTLGHVTVDLAVGQIRTPTLFHVIKGDTTYHILLGRPWTHEHIAIPSTYHQCLKAV